MAVRFSFPVATHGEEARVTVHVFDAHAPMLRALRRWHKRSGSTYPRSWYQETVACCSPYTYITEDDPTERFAAHLWFVENNYGSAVISHEASHAALYFYAQQLDRTILPTEMAEEEILCHLISEITGEVVDGLAVRGLW